MHETKKPLPPNLTTIQNQTNDLKPQLHIENETSTP